MMKNKLFLLSLGLAALLTGCSNENDTGISPGNGRTACFRLELPGNVTRAASDTYMPSRYIMEIYPGITASGTPIIRIEQNSGTFDNVELTYKTTYTCLFWADNGTPDSIVNDEYEAADLKAVKIKDDTCPANPAYGGSVQVTTDVSNADAYNVKLTHAVAKVSYIQAAPFTAAGNTLAVQFPTTYQLNVADWSVKDIETITTHTFNNIDKVGAGTTIATGYVIAPSDIASTQNITATLNDETSKNISNVPLQRNYNTNLKGSYSDFYDSEMTCTLTTEWDSPESEEDLISVWDGTTVTQPSTYSATPGEVQITSAAELAWLAQQSGTNTFAGYTFTLTVDIDLKSHLWQQIGHSNSGFRGILDGNGHSVRGVYTNNNDTENRVGFINFLQNGTVKNLTVRGYVSGMCPAGGPRNFIYGGLVGKALNATIENCTNACTVVGGGTQFKIGGVVGEADATDITNCVNDGVIKSTEGSGQINMGGIAGTMDIASGSSVLKGNINKGEITGTAPTSIASEVGGIVATVTFSLGKGEFDVSNNVNSGKVRFTGETRPNGVGGIIGYILAATSSDGGPIKVTISDNRNEGDVSSDYVGFYEGAILGQCSAAAHYYTSEIILTGNVITGGTPANTVIGQCTMQYSGTITIDGTSATHLKPYPVPNE